MKYSLENSYNFKEKGVDPNEIGDYLSGLLVHKQKLTAEIVLQDAKSTSSPLHKMFEWNDTAAANRWRLEQAASIIQSVHIIYESDEEPIVVRAFVSIGEHYEHIEEVAKVKSSRDLLIYQAAKELRLWRKKYSHMNEFFKLHNVIDDILASLIQ